MKTNLTPLDRGARVGAGLFLFTTPILNLHTYPYNLFGILLLATAAVGFSPTYALVRALLPKQRTRVNGHQALRT